MSDTVLDLITDALKRLRVLRAGETPTAADAEDALRVLNNLIGTWNLQRLTAWVDQTLTAAMVAGTQQYTVGDGGTFNGDRPPQIDRAWVTVGTEDIPLWQLTEAQWDAIPVKSTTSSYPTSFWYRPSNPLGLLNVWPVPQETYSVTLRLRTLLSTISSTATVLAFPPGYQEALTLHLALKIAPMFGRGTASAAQELKPEADEALTVLKRTNLQNVSSPLVSDFPRTPGPRQGNPYNILTNQPNPPGRW